MIRIKKLLASLLVMTFFYNLTQAKVINTESLLSEMISRDGLAKFPSPNYTLLQQSSYSTLAKNPSEPNWFDNTDANRWQGEIKRDDRIEKVIFKDFEGNGAIVRFWLTMAASENADTGTLRIYIDNEEQPIIEGNVYDIVSRGKLVGYPMSASVSKHTIETKRGHNLFLPIPYQDKCIITYEPLDDALFFYGINYRKYDESVTVESFSVSDLEKNKDLIQRVNSTLLNPYTGEGEATHITNHTLQENEKVHLKLRGTNVINSLKLKFQSEDYEQSLRSLVLKITFDDKNTVWCPVGSFFGIGHQHHPHETFLNSVKPNREMTFHYPMPFKSNAMIELVNLDKTPVTIDKLEVKSEDFEFDENTLYLHALWTHHEQIQAKPLRDINYITIIGKGKIVGDNLNIWNVFDSEKFEKSWWGEGDEKIWVDGEDFPSHFGTGTEDYYNYAWCLPMPFSHPFMSQPNGDGNKYGGFAFNNRYRILDALPFEESLVFDMELLTWFESTINYSPTVFWYGTLDSYTSQKPTPESAKIRVPKENPKSYRASPYY